MGKQARCGLDSWKCRLVLLILPFRLAEKNGVDIRLQISLWCDPREVTSLFTVSTYTLRRPDTNEPIFTENTCLGWSRIGQAPLKCHHHRLGLAWLTQSNLNEIKLKRHPMCRLTGGGTQLTRFAIICEAENYTRPPPPPSFFDKTGWYEGCFQRRTTLAMKLSSKCDTYVNQIFRLDGMQQQGTRTKTTTSCQPAINSRFTSSCCLYTCTWMD